MSKDSTHEQRVCLFAAQHFADGRNGGTISLDAYPDEEERQRPAIDLLAHDSLGPISVEHTLIEPYSAQLHDNKRVVEVFAGFPSDSGTDSSRLGTTRWASTPVGATSFPDATKRKHSIDWRPGFGRNTCPSRKFRRAARITS